MSKRKKEKYKGLNPDVNLKSRRDYNDSKYYSKKMSEKDKQWLNDFYQAYYGNDRKLQYKNFEIIESQLNKEEYGDLKQQLSRLRAERRKIWGKAPDSTTEEDRQKGYVLNEQIEELEDFLYRMVPTRKMTKDNNLRNEDFLNMTKANNTYDLVSWETLRDDELNEVQEESIFLPYEWEDEE